MEEKLFYVEYDFKKTKLDLIDKKTDKIKSKYKCLALMISLPLSNPLYPLGSPIQPEPLYKKTIVKSIDTNQGWLNFLPIENKQSNIINIENNTLRITNYSYSYDITVDIINKGIKNVNLRFMSQNPYSLLASNINDIYLNETSFSDIKNGEQIKFTITGEYQFFYINYPTTDFEFIITINKSNTKLPVLICDNKCSKCTCYDIDGNGFIKLKDKFIPVYTSRITGNIINKYLYPEFGYLRDLFYDITFKNSLPLPNKLLTLSSTLSSRPIIKFLPEYTIIQCKISDKINSCDKYLWSYYEMLSGDLVTLYKTIALCSHNVINQNTSRLRYIWSGKNDTLLFTSEDPINIYFVIYLHINGSWPYPDETQLTYREIPLYSVGDGDFGYKHYLKYGYYENYTDYHQVAFGVKINENKPFTYTNNPFNITVVEANL